MEFQALCWKPLWGVLHIQLSKFQCLCIPPLYGGLWVKPKAIHPPEKAEESKVQLLVSAQMFGQVVMRVYNGNLGDSRSNSLDWVPECGSPRSLLESMFE